MLESGKKKAGRALAAMISLVAFLFAARPARAISEESVVRDACLRTWFEGLTAEDARSAVGSSGVPVLLRLLADPAFPRRDNVVAFLTHLGGPESTPALLAFLADPPAGAASPVEDRALLLAPQALGYVAGRGDPAALAALLDMAETGAGAHGAAAASPQASMLTDLRAMAMRGLALSGDAAARAVLERRATSGPGGADGEALGRAAAQSLSLLDRGADAAGDATDPLAGGEPAMSVDPSILDSSARAQEAAITFGNHVAVTNPMTDEQLDSVLARASLSAGRSDFTGDVACCASMARSGSAGSFGAVGDGLDVIDDAAEMRTVLGSRAGRVKVVRAINYCGGPGVNVVGCGNIGGNGIAVVRYPASASIEATIWVHEYGHNVGLGHNPAGSPWIMAAFLTGSSVGLNQSECDAYQDPASGSAADVVDVGACSDGDEDSVQDAVDSCPLVANTTQADANANGIGDACECAGGPCGCGNGTVDPGEECDDGNAIDGDGCTASCTICGNGVVAPAEDCDDGNVADGDGCSAACLADCPSSPPVGCTEARTSSLVMKDMSLSSRLVDWKWSRGDATSKADFGTPRSKGAWVACLWSAGSLATSARIPAGPAWQEKTKGWIYKDARGAWDGATKALLQEGLSGRSKAQLQLKGVRVPMPALDALAAPIVVQLRGATSCQVSTFAGPFAKQSPERLVTKTIVR